MAISKAVIACLKPALSICMPTRRKRTIAILDLGTNTFRLLIAVPDENTMFKSVFEEKIYVKLAKTGIDYIGNEAYSRAIAAMERFKQKIIRHHATEVFAFATEGMRRANNSEQLIQEVKDRFDISIRRISGDMEATFIYHGVLQVADLSLKPHLLMDIGGGSTEIIIANHEKIFWKQSFPLGGTILSQMFHQQEPISQDSLTELYRYLSDRLQPLWDAARQFKQLDTLIGTSGTFSSFNKMKSALRGEKLNINDHLFRLDIPTVKAIGAHLTNCNLKERMAVKGLEPERAQLIVVGWQLAEIILDRLNIRHLFYSSYAIKEGVLWYVFNQPEIMQEEGQALHID
ncbi:MAG: hypothetical protein IPM47_18275 [Sphingobacteriales bacterium]|nr:MAG: hypothetical protein IPM47_18275 [Sphingobacteriales bacterium]